jgi:hypothetical protein
MYQLHNVRAASVPRQRFSHMIAIAGQIVGALPITLVMSANARNTWEHHV